MKTILCAAVVAVFFTGFYVTTRAGAGSSRNYPPPFPVMLQPPDTDPCVLYISTNKDQYGNPNQLCESQIPTGHEYYYEYYDPTTHVKIVVGWIPEQVVTFWLPKWNPSHIPNPTAVISGK